ncbi:dynein axonemal heavy chain 14 [Ambystoma mexicanum]|uniref:dynein axonemal heavy chain 14 n=1 Tax=Ambystoma mexicanum TaxID=8296 RepID=UPI0037E75C63
MDQRFEGQLSEQHVPGRSLLPRLHFRPENSDVLLMVSEQSMVGKFTVSISDDRNVQVCPPKPPSGTMGMKKPAAIRTSMYRTDRKRTHSIKAEKADSNDSLKLKLGMVNPTGMAAQQGKLTALLSHEKLSQQKMDIGADPEDDDVITHILRLRSKLGWPTVLPQPAYAKCTTRTTTFKNPLKDNLPLKKDDGEFVYCLPRHRNNVKGRYDPYDLQVVSASTATRCAEYWTVSASFISKITAGLQTGAMELLPVMEWFEERRLYHKICNLKIFTQFRMWKAFAVWKSNVHRSKTDHSKKMMCQQLFFVDQLFQGCLRYVQSVSEDAINIGNDTAESNDRAIVLVKLDGFHTYSLDEFCDVQRQQCNSALKQLLSCRENILEAIKQTFLKVAEGEGLQRFAQSDVDVRPNYVEAAECRRLLERFARFLKLVDNIWQGVLRCLVGTAVQQLLDNFSMSNDVSSEDKSSTYEVASLLPAASNPTNQEENANNHTQGPTKMTDEDIDKVLDDIKRQREEERIIAPVFNVTVTLKMAAKGTDKPQRNQRKDQVDFPNMPELDYFTETTEVLLNKTFKKEDTNHNTSQRQHEVASGNMKKQVTFQHNGQENANNSDGEISNDSDDDDDLTPGSLAQVYLFPTRTEFSQKIEAVVDGFEQTIAQIVAFSRESRLAMFHPQTLHSVYLSSDKDRDQTQDSLQTPWPNCELLLGLDPHYQNNVKKLYAIVDQSTSQVELYSRSFQRYSNMVDEATHMCRRISSEQIDLSPYDFRTILSKYTDYMSEVKQMKVERRIHIIKVISLQYQKACLPYLEDVMKIIHTSLPAIARAKNMQLLEAIYISLRKLEKELTAVEEFVEHLTFLGHISSELPSLEKEYNTVIQLYSVAKDYSISVPEEELAIYQTLIPSFQRLKSSILFCEARKDEDIIKFSGDLDTYISNLRFELMEFKNKVRNPVLLHADTFPGVAKEIIQNLLDEVVIISNKARSYSSYQDRFGSSMVDMKPSSLDALLSQKSSSGPTSAHAVNTELAEIECDLGLRKVLWESQEEWGKLSAEWKLTLFDNLNVDLIQRDVSRFIHTIFMLEKGLPANNILSTLKEHVMDFKQGLPVIVALRNPCLQQRHWDVIQYTIGRSITKDKSFTLGNLLELKIFQHKDKISDISTTATSEATLEGMLNKVIDLWSKTDFQLAVHQSDNCTMTIIASAEEILVQLEESQVIISTIKGSRYSGPIKNTVDEWDRKLNLFSHTLEEWMTCQRNWLYLEQIFLAPDIQRQLPAEAKLFSQVDSVWKEIMGRTQNMPNALRAATTAGALELLQTNNAHLEKIQKCLEDYLEIKRRGFPRFYFLSNEELLDILSESKNPNVVQPHLVKCFENIRGLDIQKHGTSLAEVVMIRSAEGETIPMTKSIRVRGSVEQWLGNVESSMFDLVKKLMKAGVVDWKQREFKKWVLAHPGQVVLVVSQIMFHRECVKGFQSTDPGSDLKRVHTTLVNHLEELAEMSTGILHFHQQTTLEALLILYVHCRDILADIIKKKVNSPEDFEWSRQLRYEWNIQNNTCYVVQGNASFIYGYEYLGCSSRLVITPLTDRCWLTLTGALHLHLGGSPAGPAGTGKTETVKDLAKALGKHCVVFNCSEGLDYKMMGKFFSGMAQSGAWCCFDEFNRIDMEVLSVIASQIHTIKAAKDSNAMRFLFEGREIRMNMSCAVFITMNPGYKGRVDLPDNLKSLFRPVAMMVPDYQLIAEIMLFSEGFKSAKSLSGKLVNLYQLASKQLSQQDHYDFGMRAIKTVLIMAGQKKHESASKDSTSGITAHEESLIIISALREGNLPKFLAEDVPLFEHIMADLFPGITIQKSNTRRLEKAISIVTQELCLQPWENQIEKVIQFHNQMLARHGVMLVGPSGGGKTTVRRILEKALVILPTLPSEASHAAGSLAQNVSKRGKVETFVINPKCVTLGELYGEIDPNTMEWSDGLLASAVRRLAKHSDTEHGQEDVKDRRPSNVDICLTRDSSMDLDMDPAETTMTQIPVEIKENIDRSHHHREASPDWSWIVLDGPVDTVWVENLNTVLDDTRTLCLASSERILLPNGMRMIFEVDSLSQASPATVSRCAMVYMDPVDLGWRPYMKTWISKVSAKITVPGAQFLETLFTKSVEEGLNFVHKHRKMQPFPAQEIGIVSNLCRILDAFFDFIAKNGGFCNSNTSDDISGRSTPRMHSATSFRSFNEISRNYDQAMNEGSMKAREESKWFLEKNPEKLPALLGKLYVFAFTWALGGVLTREDEHEGDLLIGLKAKDEALLNVTYDFNTFVHEIFEGDRTLGIQMPTGDKSIYDYFVDLQTGNFVPWEDLVPSTQSLIEKGCTSFSDSLMSRKNSDHQKQLASIQSLIPTIDTVRYTFLASLLLTNKHPVLITGDSGVGKSTIIQNMLKKLQKPGELLVKAGTILGDVFLHNEVKKISLLQSLSSLTVNITADDDTVRPHTGETEISLASTDADGLMYGSAQSSKRTKGIIVSAVQFGAHTSAPRTQAQILSKLSRKGRDTLGAPRFRKVVVFIDDLNMPVPEQYGAQPPLELLRQFLELGGFFDTKQLLWKHVQDVSLIAACAPPGGGRNEISPRLLKHFCMLALPQPSIQSLQHIFQIQLGIYLQQNDFLPDVLKCRDLLASASIAVYYKMCRSMLPTPAKCHYTFNLRDLFKVLQGLLQASESVIVSKESTAQFFLHEATRVFHDRLVETSDREMFYQFLSDELHNYFKVSWPKEKLIKDSIIYVDFLDMNTPVANRIYRPITNHKKLVSTLEEYLIRMSMSSAGTETPHVFFTEAVQHITRAARVFKQPGGHMMLVGLDGTGKVTSATMACYISGCSLYRLSITRSYSHMDFREDLKKAFKQTGLLGQSTVFLITDSDIVKDSFLEDLNSILNSGELPDLFDNEELDSVVMELKAAAMQANCSDDRQAIIAFFWQRVYSKLHIVLATSPAGLTFRQHCRNHPAIVNCCTIDWYDRWSEEALLNVAHSYFSQEHFVGDDQDLKERITRVCVEIHKSVSSKAAQYLKETRRHYYITPSNYLGFMNTFTNILQTKKKTTMTDRNRFHNGLSKLLEATAMVEIMQEELVALGPQIEQKSKDIEELMLKLKRDSLVVEQVRAIVKQDEEIMTQETNIVQEYAEQAKKELDDVLPALQQAVIALDSLDKANISEIRVYTHPPNLVLSVMNAVCILLQKKPDWPTAKLLLGDPGFLKTLATLDKDSLPEKVFQQLKRFSKTPDFNPYKVGMVSTACRSICLWVLALEHYHEVQKTVEPKQCRVAEALEALKVTQERLKEKQSSLAKVEIHQRSLEKQYTESVAEKELLAHRKQLTTQRLQRASVLITALDDEKGRWKESVEKLDQRLKGIVGDILVSAAFIVYGGVFTAVYRQMLVDEWLKLCDCHKVPVSLDYYLISAMAETNEVRKWQNEGLPPDQYSTENAILVKNGLRWPLLIDPHGQAYKWICQMEGNKLHQAQASDSSFMKTVENAIRFGESVLLQDVAEVLDPSLKPILGKEIYRRGGQDYIKIGDSEIEYNHNFRLYMTTQAPNPHFLPAVCIMVTMINFTVTFKGLQDQLLSSVVIHEQPQLEQERCQLLESIAQDLSTLLELENRSLTLLQKTEGHILDDQDLIETLQRSKVTSRAIVKRVEASGNTEATIKEARESYLPIATRGAVLYFVLADLIQLSYMYQFSMDWFHRLFVESIASVNNIEVPMIPSDSLSSVAGPVRAPSAQRSMAAEQNRREFSSEADRFQAHLHKIIDALTENVYKVVSSALFTEHQLCFSFLLCSNIMKNNQDGDCNSFGFLPEIEWNVFLHSALLANMMSTNSHSKNIAPAAEQQSMSETELTASRKVTAEVGSWGSGPDWLSDAIWKQSQYISTHMEVFSLLTKSFTSHTDQWEGFMSSGNVYHFLCTPYKAVSPPLSSVLHDVENEAAPGGKEELESGDSDTVFAWEQLSSFQKLVLIKILRPEYLTGAVREFILEKMGPRYLQSGGVHLKEAYEESNASTPLIFILSPGTDPAARLQRLALETRGSTLHLDMVSLGRGQGAKAEELINKAQILKGRWVFLQNCHLAASFMPRLRAIVDSFSNPNTSIDPQFRLWLSSKPDPSFPVPILQKGFKMAVEQPQGLKGKLLQTFGSSGTGEVTENSFEKVERRPSWKRLLFSLCFFNAVVNERRKYGALGWNIPYEFTSSDLEVAMQMLAMLLESQSEIPWQAVHYLTSEVVYGGRVTDNWDRRCLLSILDNFYNPTILHENYTFSSDGVYRPVSETASLQDCVSYLKSLPDTDSPEIFGMHPNAERAFLESQTTTFLDTIICMQPRMEMDNLAIRGGKNHDDVVMEIVSNILSQLPQTVEGNAAEGATAYGNHADAHVSLGGLMSGHLWNGLAKAAPANDSLINSALITVLRQEIDRFNQLLSVVLQSLCSMQQAIRGEVLLTKGLEEVYSSLVNLKVPSFWQQHSYESCKSLGSWVEDLIQRVDFFATWANHVVNCIKQRFGFLTDVQKKSKTAATTGNNAEGSSSEFTEQPGSFWLSGFFFPQGFLTAVLQNYARAKGISVDSLIFCHHIQPFMNSMGCYTDAKKKLNITQMAFKGSPSPAEGVLVFGLYLDGAKWNSETQTLEDSDLRDRFYPLPEIHFVPQQIINETENENNAGPACYECPLYRTPQRAGILSSTGLSTNFVTTVSLPTQITPRHWITRGAALLCQLDD